jgi:tetratricopeptide (TPR) repeat protein
VRVQITKAFLAVAALSALGFGSAWGQAQQPAQDNPQQTQQAQPAQPPAQPGQTAQPQQPAQPKWKDRDEYDLVEAIRKEADPKRKLARLDEWTQKYASTDFKEMRLEMYMDAYRQLNDPTRMLDAARKLLADYPKNMSGEYWADMLIVSTNAVNPTDLDLAERAAQGLLAAEKPAAATDEQWKATKQTMDITAHRTLGWVAMQRKSWDVAEQHFAQELKLNPADAQASYWLGNSILNQKKTERQSEALYYFARAAAYDGPGALDAATRQKMEAYVQKAYTSYHGQDPQGFQQLLSQAKTSPSPPSGFKILSSDEIKEQQSAALKVSNPALALWVTIKTALTAADGASYFDQSVKNAQIPPEGQLSFKGTLISGKPEVRPRTLVLGVEKPDVADATLVLPEGESLPGKVEPGRVIEFRGVVQSFAPAPFMITFDVEKKNITGWPAPAPPKKAAPKKGAARRKP